MTRNLLYLLLCTSALCLSLGAREFTNQQGVTIEAAILGLSDGQVELKRGKQTYRVSISEFVAADQKYIRDWAKQQQEQVQSKHQAESFAKHGIKSTPGLHAYNYAEAGRDESPFYVVVPNRYDGSQKMPLIVSAHGADQKGDKEIKGWQKLADEFSCIVVASTNLSGARRLSLSEHCTADLKKLEHIMKRVTGTLAIDEKKVMHTGFSAGGYLTFFSMKLGDEFTHLCFRCCNYSEHLKPFVGTTSKQWKGKPIYWFYGTKDARSVLREVDNAKAFLDESGCELKWEKIEGWSHRDDKRRAIEWLIKTPHK